MSDAPPISVSVASPPRRLWWLMVVCAGSILLGFALGPNRFRAVGVNHYGVWFLDLHAILASGDAVAVGLDPYVANPLDYFGRPHGYSHWWLALGRMGFTRADTLLLGLVLGAGFFVTAIAALRPRRLREVLWTIMVLCSPPILLGLDRANIDLAMFILLAPVVPCLLSTQPGVRLIAVPLIIAATVLKAYPIVAGLILLAGHGPRDTRRLVFAAAVLLAVALPDMASDFPRYAKIVPETEGLMTMGSRNLFVGLGLPLGAARILGPLGGVAIVAMFLRSKFFAGWTVAPEDRAAWLSFVLGAVLLTGCFFAGASFAYRWVFAIWLLPLLWRLPRDAAAPVAVRRLAWLTAALLGFALWADAFVSSALGNFFTGLPPERVMALADRFFYLEQPMTWGLFVCLLGFLTHFGREGVRQLFSAEPAERAPARSAPATR